MTTSLNFSNIRVAGIASPDATVQIYFGKQAEGWFLNTSAVSAGGGRAAWEGEFSAEVQEDRDRNISVAIFDPTRNQVYGFVSFQLEVTSRNLTQSVDASTDDGVRFEARLLIEPPPPAVSLPTRRPPAQPASGVVVRREMREMPRDEQLRFCRAVEKMMENVDGRPESSEFFRLASYHGWPGRVLCAHGNETFPAWHRGYLVAFERALQTADRALGNDGRLGLPYWDCATSEINGQVVPAVLREYFHERSGPHATVRALIADPQGRAPARQLWNLGYSNINPDFVIRRHLEASDVRRSTNRALWVAQHWRAASSEGDSRRAAGRAQNSIEKPHDEVHGFCGYPMNVIDFAAYHPLFWLHHCNIDRLYESYIAIHGRAESMNEYRARQASRTTNMFERWLAPFEHPATGENLVPADTFDTRALGYMYDALQQRAPQRLEEAPTIALFESISPMKFKGVSLVVHVLAFGSKGAAAKARVPHDKEALMAHPAYAGTAVVFHGLTGKCDNCLLRPPYPLSVDITARVRELGVGRHQVALLAVCEDQEGNLVPRETTAVPAPTVVGPYFDSRDASLKRGAKASADASEAGDTLALQSRLKALGYYAGKLDAHFGPKTDKAVRGFQSFTGLKVDGVAGPISKAALTATRFDADADVAEKGDRRVQKAGSEIKYVVGNAPGYLHRGTLLNEIAAALAQWAQPSGLRFRRLPRGEEQHAQLTIGFAEGPGASAFDGEGGALAHADATSIELDADERWLLQGQKPTDASGEEGPSFALLPVVLHEAGHMLGLVHSSDPRAVMAPFYDAAKVRLTDGDRARARALYAGASAAPPPPPQELQLPRGAPAPPPLHQVMARMSIGGGGGGRGAPLGAMGASRYATARPNIYATSNSDYGAWFRDTTAQPTVDSYAAMIDSQPRSGRRAK